MSASAETGDRMGLWSFRHSLAALLLVACLAAPSPTLAQQPSPMRRIEALAAIKSGDVATRQVAVLSLGLNGRMQDAPALVAALRDADEAVRALAEHALWLVWSRSGDAETDRLFLQGVDEMNAGRLAEAAATFSRVITRQPAFAEGWNKRATVRFLAGDYRGSLADCDEVMKRNPNHFGALAGYGQIYLRLGEPERALEYFRKALAVNPNMTGVEIAARTLENELQARRGKAI